MILSRTPLRITIGGGGTDLPSFYQKHGGFVISLAINKYIYITYKPDHFERNLKLRYSRIEIVDDVSQLVHHRAKEALMLHGIRNGCEINSCADIPSQTGLGSSGSFLVGLLNVIREYKRIDRSPHVLAEEACHIEIDRLGEPVGKQDQFIAAYGGLKKFEISEDGEVTASDVNMTFGAIQQLLSNMHVYYLRVKRDASDILVEQKQLKNNSEQSLMKVKEYGYETLRLIESGDFDSYGRLLDEYWRVKKRLSNKISLSFVDELYERVKAEYGVLGGKIIGAGGGGFLLLYAPTNKTELDAFMAASGYERLHYNMDEKGSIISGNF